MTGVRVGSELRALERVSSTRDLGIFTPACLKDLQILEAESRRFSRPASCMYDVISDADMSAERRGRTEEEEGCAGVVVVVVVRVFWLDVRDPGWYREGRRRCSG